VADDGLDGARRLNSRLTAALTRRFWPGGVDLGLVTFHLTRLGFEAQNAAAFRFLRLVGNAGRTEADEIISDTIAPPLDSPPAAIKVTPKGRRSMSKVYKKPARTNKRNKHSN
jgi:hypothetical protein